MMNAQTTFNFRRMVMEHDASRITGCTVSGSDTLHRLPMRPNNERPVVLVVGGWSPGPLLYLQQVLASRRSLVVQPRNLSMPPFPGSWCCNPMVLGMVAICGTFLWLTCVSHATIAWNIVALVATLIALRFLVAVVVRTSIQVSAQSCLEATRQYDGNVILLGFSWGGAVIAELLAQGKFGDRPRALLIAPTTSLVASISMTQDAAFKVHCNHGVHVVHGTDDLAFCPNQTRWEGGNLQRIRDNHVFFRQSSQHILVDLLNSILDDVADSRS